MCATLSRKKGKTVLVHESSDSEESDSDEPQERKKGKRAHEASDSEESDLVEPEDMSSDESKLDVSNREKLETSVCGSVQRPFIAKKKNQTLTRLL